MNADQLVAQAVGISVPSPAAVGLMIILTRPTTQNNDIIRLVQYDEELTAKLLRVCNSVLVGSPAPVESVSQAVMLLGYREIFKIVVALAFGGPLSQRLPGYAIERQELWRHSLTTALVSESIAASNPKLQIDPSLAFTSALLHDIGKLVLETFLNSRAESAVRSKISTDGLLRTEAERSILGADHAQVGAQLLKKWRIPAVIVEGVANHHQPPRAAQPAVSTVIHVANNLAHQIGSGPGWSSFAVGFDETALESLGLGQDALERLLIDAYDSLARVESFVQATAH